eukprot:6568483-Ditylum_brightwellii.AAC.1
MPSHQRIGIMTTAAYAAAAAMISTIAGRTACNAFSIQSITRASSSTSSIRFAASPWISATTNTNSRTMRFSTTTEGESTTEEANAELINGRISRGTISSLDARTVTDNLPLVLSHLKSRRASAEAMEAAERIAALNEDR